jgi:hypothetical protein
MWVAQLARHIHSEGRIPIDLLIAEFDKLARALHGEILFEDGIDDWIEIFVEILKQEGESEVDAHFQVLQKVAIVKRLDSPGEIFALLFLDPRHGLHLRVNTEWKRRGLRAKYTVLHRKLVGWQSLARPFDDFDFIREKHLQIDGVVLWDLPVG